MIASRTPCWRGDCTCDFSARWRGLRPPKMFSYTSFFGIALPLRIAKWEMRRASWRCKDRRWMRPTSIPGAKPSASKIFWKSSFPGGSGQSKPSLTPQPGRELLLDRLRELDPAAFARLDPHRFAVEARHLQG